MNEFKFKLGDAVRNNTSGESGEVIGRAEYKHCESSYWVRHKAADGRACESWWSESAIVTGPIA